MVLLIAQATRGSEAAIVDRYEKADSPMGAGVLLELKRVYGGRDEGDRRGQLPSLGASFRDLHGPAAEDSTYFVINLGTYLDGVRDTVRNEACGDDKGSTRPGDQRSLASVIHATLNEARYELIYD